MSWLRVDDTFVEHPKVIDLSDRSFRLHVAGMCFCARNLTDGVLVKRSVSVVCALSSATRKHVAELVEAGLWVKAGDGFEVKDFLIYNPTGEKVKADRDAARDRMRKVRSGERSRERSATPAPDPSLEQALTTGLSEDFKPPEQIRAVAALVDRSLKSGPADAAAPPPSAVPRSGIDALIDLLPASEVAPNTRGVLEGKFSQLPPHFVELAREELLAAGDDVRSRIRYLNGIANRMLRERADRATPAAERDAWVRANAAHPDVHDVIDDWRDIDDVDRQQLHELAERLRDDTSTTNRKAA